MPEEITVGINCHSRIVFSHIHSFQPFSKDIHSYHSQESCHERLEPIRILATQNIVHKHLREQWSGNSDYGRQQSGDKDKESCCPRILQTAFNETYNRRARASPLKSLCRFESQSNPRIRLIEFVLRNLYLPSGGIVQVMSISFFSLIYHKVIEVPMNDDRCHFLKFILIQLVGIGIHAITPSGQQQLFGRTAVSGNSTILSELLQR